MSSPREILKKQKLMFFGSIGAVGVLILGGIWITDPNNGNQVETQVVAKDSFKVDSSVGVTPEDSWIALSEQKLEEMRRHNLKLQEQLAGLVQKIDGLQKQNEELARIKASEKVDSPVPSYEPKLKSLNETLPGYQMSAPDRPMIEAAQVDDKIAHVSISSPKLKAKKKITHFIPSGSFAKVALLSGLDAPTGGLAQKNPMPVVMKVLDLGTLPNRFKSNIRECQVTGAGHGIISSERAYIRLEKLSCVLKNGIVIEEKVRGYVTGEDGKPGFRGNVVSKQGALIARAALAGTLAGIGSAVAQSYQTIQASALGTVQTLDPKKAMQAGLTNGAGNALNKIAQFYIDRANETYPIIEISSGRKGEMVLNDGVDLKEKIRGEVQ